jgi:hypothetical protein
VAKRSYLLLPVVLAAALAGAQSPVTNLGRANPDLRVACIGSPLTCSQPFTVAVPTHLVPRARLKARLITLLRESLYDDAKGIVNIPREKEIKNIANKLRNDRE